MRRTLNILLIISVMIASFHPVLYAKTIKKRKIRKLFKHSQIVNDHFTGFALYDLDKDEIIYELNADKYFTPASNTKLFTFYTCLKILGDSIPSLRYTVHQDSMIFWGTGDPSFLHSDLKGTKAYDILKRTDKQLYFASGLYKNQLYGQGWAWDDYNDYYQAEINELPIEDNVARLYTDQNGTLQIKPAFFKPYLKVDSSLAGTEFKVKRNFLTNVFIYPPAKLPAHFRQEIPWKTSSDVTLALLQDTLHKDIKEIHRNIDANTKMIFNCNADSVYKRMLQPSDNFIAEQLLLVCSSVKFGILDADSVIRYSKRNFLNDLPDEPQWVDGSGLSRQNLFTPRTIIALLVKIQKQVNNDQLLHSLMPAGGVSGTLKRAYKTDNGQAFVWAKTGSLTNNHNQSGYLVTRKGKRLAFSFMNNNFVRPSAQIRDEMVNMMTYIHDHY